MDFLRKINVFGGEHAQSAIGVSNSLKGFREEVVGGVRRRLGCRVKREPTRRDVVC